MSQLKFKQYVYYNASSANNVGINSNFVNTGVLQFNNAIQHIGVQALPGTKFYLGNREYPVIVGFLGFVEIDLTSLGASYSSIEFDMNSINLINNNDSAVLIVDTTYIEG